MSRLRQMKDLIIKGSEHLQAGEFAKAQKISQKLIHSGIPQGYLMKFQAHAHRNQTNEALQTLRDYTSTYPEDLIAWKTLAEFCRDHDLFEEGIGAYDKALGCEDAPLEKIYLARASIKVRAKQFSEALEDLDKIPAIEELSLPVRVMKMSCYNGMKEYSKVLEMGPEILADVQIASSKELDRSIPMLNYNTRFELAYAHWKTSGSQGESMQNLFQAFRHIKVAPPPALELLREINAQDFHGTCKFFEIIISAKTREPVMQHGHPHEDFVRQYEVLAEDPEECLEFICELETEIQSNSLRIRKATERELPLKPEFKGVYFQSLPELLHNH